MLIKKITNLFSFKPARLVLAIDYKESKSYKQLELASKEATNLETWKDGGDKAQTEINNRCDAAVSEHGTQTKTEEGNIDKKWGEAMSNKRAEIEASLGTKPDKGAPEYAEWRQKFDAKWDAEIRPMQAQQAAEKGAAWKEHEAVRARMYSLRDTAISQMRAAFDAKEKAKEKITKKVGELMNQEVDPWTKRDFAKRARFAQDLADDGILSSWSGEVSDYLDSKINGVKLNDSDIENMTMGIVAVLHNREAGDNDPAKKFMAGLSEKESASGDILSFDDRGVGISDVQMQVLQNLGYKTGSREDYQEARESEAAKLFGQIASDKNIPSHLRGMLLGKLASGNEKSRKETMKTVQSMYTLLLSKGKIEDLEDYAGLTGAAIGASLSGPLSPLGAILGGVIGQGYSDENALEHSGAILAVLEDMQHVMKFQELKSRYEAMGLTNKAVDKIINEATSPLAMKKRLGELQKAVDEAQVGGDRDAPIKKIKENSGYADAKKLFARFGIKDFPYEAKLNALAKDKTLSAPEFAASLAELETRLKNSAEDPALVAKAAESRDSVNKRIAAVNAYRENWHIIGKIHADRLTILPVEPFTQITAISPLEYASEWDKIENDLKTAEQIVEANKVKCDKYAKIYGKNKRYKRRGGGGTRPRPAPRGAVPNAASKTAESRVKVKKVDYSNVGVGERLVNEYVMVADGVKKPKALKQEPRSMKDPGGYEVTTNEGEFYVMKEKDGKTSYYKKRK